MLATLLRYLPLILQLLPEVIALVREIEAGLKSAQEPGAPQALLKARVAAQTKAKIAGLKCP